MAGPDFSLDAKRRIIKTVRTVEGLTSSGGNVIRPAFPRGGAGVFAVIVSQADGQAGSNNMPPTFTYYASNLAGVSLATNAVQVRFARPIGQVTAGQMGLACYDDDGALLLLLVDETPVVNVCSAPAGEG